MSQPDGRFDVVEIGRVIEIRTPDGDRYCEQVFEEPLSEAIVPHGASVVSRFWSIYGRFESDELARRYGRSVCIGDFTTRQAAWQVARSLGLPIVERAMAVDDWATAVAGRDSR